MTPLFKSIVIVLIATAVVVPTGVYAYRMSQNPGTDLAEFIPSGSTFAMSYTNNSSTYYAFSDNGSAALIAPVSLSSLANEYSGNVTHNVTGILHYFKFGINLTVNRTFHGYTLFRIGVNETFNLSTLENELTSKLQDYNGGLNNYNLDLNRSFNTSLFVTQLNSGNIELGGIGAIENSINAYRNGTNMLKAGNTVFKTSANLTVYANFTNRAFRTVSINVFTNYTTVNATFSNQSSESNFSALLGALQEFNSSLVTREVKGDGYVFAQLSLGMENLTRTSKANNDN